MLSLIGNAASRSGNFLCLLIHGCLVAFRTIGFALFSDIPSTTYALAATEWINFIGSVLLFRVNSRDG
jgi:hypothetical protein